MQPAPPASAPPAGSRCSPAEIERKRQEALARRASMLSTSKGPLLPLSNAHTGAAGAHAACARPHPHATTPPAAQHAPIGGRPSATHPAQPLAPTCPVVPARANPHALVAGGFRIVRVWACAVCGAGDNVADSSACAQCGTQRAPSSSWREIRIPTLRSPASAGGSPRLGGAPAAGSPAAGSPLGRACAAQAQAPHAPPPHAPLALTEVQSAPSPAACPARQPELQPRGPGCAAEAAAAPCAAKPPPPWPPAARQHEPPQHQHQLHQPPEHQHQRQHQHQQEQQPLPQQQPQQQQQQQQPQQPQPQQPQPQQPQQQPQPQPQPQRPQPQQPQPQQPQQQQPPPPQQQQQQPQPQPQPFHPAHATPLPPSPWAPSLPPQPPEQRAQPEVARSAAVPPAQTAAQPAPPRLPPHPPPQPPQPPPPPPPSVRVHARAELGERGRLEYHVPEAAPGARAQLNALLRGACAQGAFDERQRVWRLTEANLAALRARADVSVAVEPLPPMPQRAAALAAELERAHAAAPARALEEAVPAEVLGRLMPYQREGVSFALRCDGRVLIADEMGLGKTVQAICVLAAYRADWPALVLAPPSLAANWRAELLKWLPEEVLQNACVQLIASGKDEPRDDAHVVILTYALAEKMGERLGAVRGGRGFGVLVCDESHNLKTLEAKRTKAVQPLAARARRCVLLSGTPATSRPAELFSQLQLLQPRVFCSYDEFTLRYCAAHQGRYGWDVSGRSNLDELHKVLTGTVMVRRTKADVLAQLPPKTRRTVWLEPASAAAAAELRAARAAAEAAGAKGGARALARDSTELTALYTVSGAVKAPPAVAFVQRALDRGVKLLAFAHHRAVLDSLCGALESARVRHVRIDGQTPSAQRAERVEAFQAQQDVRVAVLGITAAGTGLTLTQATLIVFLELTWNVSDLQQAEDRAHRIGQTQPVEVAYLLMKGSVDDMIWPTVNRKLDTVSRAIDGHAGAKLAAADAAGGSAGATPGCSAAPLASSSNRIDRYFGGAAGCGGAAGQPGMKKRARDES